MLGAEGFAPPNRPPALEAEDVVPPPKRPPEPAVELFVLGNSPPELGAEVVFLFNAPKERVLLPPLPPTGAFEVFEGLGVCDPKGLPLVAPPVVLPNILPPAGAPNRLPVVGLCVVADDVVAGLPKVKPLLPLVAPPPKRLPEPLVGGFDMVFRRG